MNRARARESEAYQKALQALGSGANATFESSKARKSPTEQDICHESTDAPLDSSRLERGCDPSPVREVAMKQPASSSNDATARRESQVSDMKPRGVRIPVSDVDRAKEFYSRLRWRPDPTAPQVTTFAFQFHASRFRQLGPIRRDFTSAAPVRLRAASAVSDTSCARGTRRAGVDASEGFHSATGTACRFPGNGERISGPHSERLSYGLFRSVVPIGSPAFNRSLGAKWRAFDGSRCSIRKSPRSEKENLCSCRE